MATFSASLIIQRHSNRNIFVAGDVNLKLILLNLKEKLSKKNFTLSRLWNDVRFFFYENEIHYGFQRKLHFCLFYFFTAV